MMLSQTLAFAPFVAAVAAQLNLGGGLGGELNLGVLLDPNPPGTSPTGWTYLGCFSSALFPDDGQLQSAPLGTLMTAQVCTDICNLSGVLGGANYAIVYDTDFCLCLSTNRYTLSNDNCFQQCGLLALPDQSCGAAGKGVVYQRGAQALKGHVAAVLILRRKAFDTKALYYLVARTHKKLATNLSIPDNDAATQEHAAVLPSLSQDRCSRLSKPKYWKVAELNFSTDEAPSTRQLSCKTIFSLPLKHALSLTFSDKRSQLTGSSTYIIIVALQSTTDATILEFLKMPLLAKKHVEIPKNDILSWMYDEPQFDHSVPIYIDAYDTSNSISAEQAKILIRQLIAGFRHVGVREGDRVLVHSFNSIYYPILVLSIIGCGAIYTGSNPAYTAYELSHAFRSCAPKLVICDPEAMNDGFISAAQGSNLSPSGILIFDTPTINSLHATQEPQVRGLLSWRSLLIHGEANWMRFNDEVTSRKTVAGLFFSSGTTGLPKLTQLSHYNLVAQHVLAFEHFPRPYVLKRLIALPMFHAATAPSTHISPLRSGHPQVVMRRYDPGTFLDMCAEHQITDLTLVPPQVISLLAHSMPETRKRALLKSVRLAYGGAAPLDAVTQSRFQALLPNGSPFTQVMGMTETSCFASLLPYPEDDGTGSVGRFLPNLDVKLLDDSGTERHDYSQPGELAIRGPTVTEGYVGVPRERDFDAEGYLRTGDILYQDRTSGLWYIVDRKKEMIKVRGFQVAPKELEGVLLEHTGIADAAVIGVAGEDGAELPRAYVVRKRGVALNEAAVKSWVEGKLARYKWLTGGVIFVDSIPKSPSGKILKRVLREGIQKVSGPKL